MVSAGLHLAAAAACLLWAALAVAAGRGRVPRALALGALATGLWAAAVAFAPADPLHGWPGVAEGLRSLVWLGVLLTLYHRYAGAIALRPVVRFAAGGLALAAAGGVAAWLAPSP
ncbi:MAG: PEP-CTERM system histidine kinase PrsK, partial [Elioraea sp.]|nr:PEP-CTERM system histidine kinase PrsK [Elioraea sp.]